MNEVIVTLRNPTNKSELLNYYIDVYDAPMSELWYSALQEVLRQNKYLEKNFCFLGFPDSQRDLNYICKELAWAVDKINNFFDPAEYHISEVFTPETMLVEIGRAHV